MGAFSNISKTINKAKASITSLFRTQKVKVGVTKAVEKNEAIALENTKELKHHSSVSSNLSYRRRRNRKMGNSSQKDTPLNERTIKEFGTFRAIKSTWYLPRKTKALSEG